MIDTMSTVTVVTDTTTGQRWTLDEFAASAPEIYAGDARCAFAAGRLVQAVQGREPTDEWAALLAVRLDEERVAVRLAAEAAAALDRAAGLDRLGASFVHAADFAGGLVTRFAWTYGPRDDDVDWLLIEAVRADGGDPDTLVLATCPADESPDPYDAIDAPFRRILGIAPACDY